MFHKYKTRQQLKRASKSEVTPFYGNYLASIKGTINITFLTLLADFVH